MTWLKRLAMSFLAKDYISEEYHECFVEKPEEFEFSRGQKKLIQEIVVFIKEETASKGNDFFSFKSKMKPNKVVDRKLFQGEFDAFSIQARI